MFARQGGHFYWHLRMYLSNVGQEVKKRTVKSLTLMFKVKKYLYYV